MRYIGIIILLVLCLNLLLFNVCETNTVKPEPASGNLENQEDIDQSSNNSQNSSTGPIEEPVIEEDTGETVTVYPQQWARGDGTVENPWANDCIQKAHDFVPAGGTVYLKAGYYTLSYAITITKKINIIGEGRNKTIIITANAMGFNVTADYVTIKGMTIDGDAQDNADYKAPINVGTGADYVILEDIEVKNSGYYGIGMYQNNYAQLTNIYAHDNYRHGVSGSSNTDGLNIHNTYRDIYAWDNGFCGLADRNAETTTSYESYNTYDNIQSWDNGNHGIAISNMSNIVLSNSNVSGNTGSGLYFNYLKDFNVDNCSGFLSESSDTFGVYLMDSTNINFTNVIAKNNKLGIRLEDCDDIVLTSCQSYDDRETPLQLFGLQLEGTNTDISLVNCVLTPNQYGEIYNPSGAVVTVITKKMLAKF